MPGDYDGDGVTDPTVFRPSTGLLVHPAVEYQLHASATYQWGLTGDVPMPGDYDGDGTTDLAVYRPSQEYLVHPVLGNRLHDLGLVSVGTAGRYHRAG